MHGEPVPADPGGTRNAALMGRELPPAEVLAADQRITAWARQLKKAGLEGDMDELRARAYLDLLLGQDSRPRRDAGCQDTAGSEPDGSGGGSVPAGPGNPAAGAKPGGFAGRVTVTVPLTTLSGQADRPGEIPGIGPVDPKPGANTSNRYQNGASAEPGTRPHQRTGPLPPHGRSWWRHAR